MQAHPVNPNAFLTYVTSLTPPNLAMGSIALVAELLLIFCNLFPKVCVLNAQSMFIMVPRGFPMYGEDGE
jgi:hypothetical protein